MSIVRIACCLAFAFHTTTARADGEAVDLGPWRSATLPSSGLHEECVAIKRGQRLAYGFEAASAIDFNIHTTGGPVMRFLVKKSAARRAEAAFRPSLPHDYCMMWSNPGANPVQFRYRYRLD